MGTVPGIIKKYGTNWYDKSQFGLSFINGTSSIDESKIRVLQIIGRTNSDSSGNAFDISGMAAAAGSIGEMLPNLGQSDTATGIKAVPARTLPPNPLVVRRFDDVVRALDIQGALANFTVAQKEALLRTINRLNDRQIASINNAAGAEQISQLLQCAGIQNIEIVKQGAAGVDPRVDAKMQAIWGINAGTATNNDSVIRAAMVYNTLQKNAGTSGLTRGGYDYHGSSIAQQDAKDAVIGQDCAKIVQSAAALGKDVAVFICTDGSCSHPSSATRTGPTGDNNNSTQVLIMYKNDGAFTTKAPQIGQWSASQGVDLNAGTGPGDNQVMLAQIVMANILKMAKKDNMISAITGLSPTNPNIKVQA